jgi:hypothetical protein
MLCRIIIETFTFGNPEDVIEKNDATRSEVWRGDINITNPREYLTRIQVIADGEAQPICDIPFGIGMGHWMYIPPNNDEVENDI